MFGFFKKKEVAPPIKETISVPKEHAEKLIKLYSDASLYSSSVISSYGLKHKYDLWNFVYSISEVNDQIEAIKNKYPTKELALNVCLKDIIRPQIVITEAK